MSSFGCCSNSYTLANRRYVLVRMLFELSDSEKQEAAAGKGRKGRFKCNSATNRDFIEFSACLVKCNKVQRSATAQHHAAIVRSTHAGLPVGRTARATAPASRIFEYFSRCQRARAWLAAASVRGKEIKRTVLWTDSL